MSRFTDLYIQKNRDRQARMSEDQIADNPIGAYVAGISENVIRKSLKKNEYTDDEVDFLIAQAKKIS